MKFRKKTTARRICAGLFGRYALWMLYLLFFQRRFGAFAATACGAVALVELL